VQGKDVRHVSIEDRERQVQSRAMRAADVADPTAKL
jgi:hypothetical protein